MTTSREDARTDFATRLLGAERVEAVRAGFEPAGPAGLTDEELEFSEGYVRLARAKSKLFAAMADARLARLDGAGITEAHSQFGKAALAFQRAADDFPELVGLSLWERIELLFGEEYVEEMRRIAGAIQAYVSRDSANVGAASTCHVRRRLSPRARSSRGRVCRVRGSRRSVARSGSRGDPDPGESEPSGLTVGWRTQASSRRFGGQLSRRTVVGGGARKGLAA